MKISEKSFYTFYTVPIFMCCYIYKTQGFGNIIFLNFDFYHLFCNFLPENIYTNRVYVDFI